MLSENFDCEFQDPGRLIDEDLELVLVETCPPDPATGRVPEYRFEMRLVGNEMVIGSVSLRTQCTDRLEQYGGNLSYDVTEQYRGNRYAARSCRLLLPFAISHGLDSLLITCHADNRASRRTCELLGAKYVDTFEIKREPGEFGPTRRYELLLKTEDAGQSALFSGSKEVGR